MQKKYIVSLTSEERETLLKLISVGKGSARRLTHARILILADQGKSDDAIAEAVLVGRATVERVRKRLVVEGLEAALDPYRSDKPRLRKVDGHAEAHLIALACTSPPKGQKRWTLRLLADKLVELEVVDSLSHETVRRILKKTRSSRGSSANGSSRPKRTPSSSTTSKMSWRSTPVRMTRVVR